MMNTLEIILISNNLGDSKSIITHPETTTHQRLSQDQKDLLGITPGLLRLSIGLESAKDLNFDLQAALDVAFIDK
jgi:O-succinylhomoserine sulfhydrylase